jgi:uncharacterized membrane protein
VEHEEATGSSGQEDPDGGPDRDGSLITPREGLVIGVSAIAGIWVGCAAGAEAGSATALAVATLLDRLFQRDR